MQLFLLSREQISPVQQIKVPYVFQGQRCQQRILDLFSLWKGWKMKDMKLPFNYSKKGSSGSHCKHKLPQKAPTNCPLSSTEVRNLQGLLRSHCHSKMFQFTCCLYKLRPQHSYGSYFIKMRWLPCLKFDFNIKTDDTFAQIIKA